MGQLESQGVRVVAEVGLAEVDAMPGNGCAAGLTPEAAVGEEEQPLPSLHFRD